MKIYPQSSYNTLGEGVGENHLYIPELYLKIPLCALLFPHHGVPSRRKTTITTKQFFWRVEKQLQNSSKELNR